MRWNMDHRVAVFYFLVFAENVFAVSNIFSQLTVQTNRMVAIQTVRRDGCAHNVYCQLAVYVCFKSHVCRQTRVAK